MNDIYKLINDNEKDDLIIKEITEFILYSLNNNIKPCGYFLDRILKIYLRNSSISINDFIVEGDNNIDGGFYKSDRILYVNVNNLEDRKQNYIKYYDIENNIILDYFVAMEVLFHELTHVKQYDLRKNNLIYNFCFDFINNNYHRYNQIHHLVPIERLADTRSMYLAYQILKNIFDDNKLDSVKLINLTRFLSYYKIIDNNIKSPIETFNSYTKDLVRKEFITLIPNIELNNDNLFDRVRLGYKITISEFDEQIKKLIK